MLLTKVLEPLQHYYCNTDNNTLLTFTPRKTTDMYSAGPILHTNLKVLLSCEGAQGNGEDKRVRYQGHHVEQKKQESWLGGSCKDVWHFQI